MSSNNYTLEGLAAAETHVPNSPLRPTDSANAPAAVGEREPTENHPTGRSKAVILVGGPRSGGATQFRPLSRPDRPKALFPVTGFPAIYHIINACAKVTDLNEILLIGTHAKEHMADFLLSQPIKQLERAHQVSISYLPEGTKPLGTAGGIYKFRGQIQDGGIDCFFVINSDICADFALPDLLVSHSQHGDGGHLTIMSVKARKEQAVNYGNVLVSPGETKVKHYQEKPENPELMGNYAEINSGVYVLSPGVFSVMDKIVTSNYKATSGSEAPDRLMLEGDIFPALASAGQLFVHRSNNYWSQIKTAGSAIYASRHYLQAYRTSSDHDSMLSAGDNIVGDVWIHPNADVDATAKLGPNVSISAGVKIGAGVRIKDSILLEGVTVGEHSVVLNAIIDQRSSVGRWSRVEGAAVGVNPNDPTTHEPPKPLFSNDGRLNPLVTTVGEEVTMAEGCMVMNVICMPNKELGSRKYANEIII